MATCNFLPARVRSKVDSAKNMLPWNTAKKARGGEKSLSASSTAAPSRKEDETELPPPPAPPPPRQRSARARNLDSAASYSSEDGGNPDAPPRSATSDDNSASGDLSSSSSSASNQGGVGGCGIRCCIPSSYSSSDALYAPTTPSPLSPLSKNGGLPSPRKILSDADFAKRMLRAMRLGPTPGAPLDPAIVSYDVTQRVKSSPSPRGLMERASKSGWLSKMNKDKVWSKRYVSVVHQTYLYIFQSASPDSLPLGVLDLSLYDRSQLIPGFGSSDGCVLELSRRPDLPGEPSSVRPYSFRASSKADAAKWSAALLGSRQQALLEEKRANDEILQSYRLQLDHFADLVKHAETAQARADDEAYKARQITEGVKALALAQVALATATIMRRSATSGGGQMDDYELKATTEKYKKAKNPSLEFVLNELLDAARTSWEEREELRRKTRALLHEKEASERSLRSEMEGKIARVEQELEDERAASAVVAEQERLARDSLAELVSLFENSKIEFSISVRQKEKAEEKVSILLDQRKILIREVKGRRREAEECRASVLDYQQAMVQARAKIKSHEEHAAMKDDMLLFFRGDGGVFPPPPLSATLDRSAISSASSSYHLPSRQLSDNNLLSPEARNCERPATGMSGIYSVPLASDAIEGATKSETDEDIQCGREGLEEERAGAEDKMMYKNFLFDSCCGEADSRDSLLISATTCVPASTSASPSQLTDRLFSETPGLVAPPSMIRVGGERTGSAYFHSAATNYGSAGADDSVSCSLRDHCDSPFTSRAPSGESIEDAARTTWKTTSGRDLVNLAKLTEGNAANWHEWDSDNWHVAGAEALQLHGGMKNLAVGFDPIKDEDWGGGLGIAGKERGRGGSNFEEPSSAATKKSATTTARGGARSMKRGSYL